MTLTHSIPDIGIIEVKLGGLPERLFCIMEQKGEVSRLERLLHLGMLHKAFPGMRHTRWDYTMAILYFIQKISEAGWEGLPCSKKVAGVKISGRDILQILALVINIGHLPGTFSVEKGVSRFLNARKDLLASLLREADLKANNLLVDYTNLNRILALVKLNEWLTSADTDFHEPLKVAKKLLSEVILNIAPTEHRRRMFEYFNLIRRFAYQTLDCLYVNLPVVIDYKGFVFRPHIFSPKVRYLVSDLVDNYTRVVYNQIYHSDEACRLVAIWSDAIYHLLEKSQNPLYDIKKWLKKALIDDIPVTLKEDNPKNVLSITLPHRFGPNLLTRAFHAKNVDVLEMEILKENPSSKTAILYIPGLRGELRFSLFINSDLDISPSMLIWVLIWFYQKFNDVLGGTGLFIKATVERLLEITAGEGIESTINVAPDEFFHERIQPFLVPEDKIKIFRASQKEDALKLFKDKEQPDWEPLVKAQFLECKMLKEVTYKVWERPKKGIVKYYVVIPGQIKFRSHEEDLCEFDGALLKITKPKGKKKSKTSLFLLEAKSGRRTAIEDAQRDLQNKLQKLGGVYAQGKVKKLGRKSAYAIVEIPCSQRA